MRKDILVLFALIAVFLAIGGFLIATRLLPEDQAQNFNPLSAGNMSLKSELKVIKEPTPEDNTFIYAINDVAEEAFNVAKQDARVQQILDNVKGKVVTIAAVQPTLLRGSDGKLIHSSGGQVIITANWQLVDNELTSDALDFVSLQDKKGESHQQIWNVLVDLDKRVVTNISVETERVVRETLHQNLVYAGMNVFLPDAVKVDAGTAIKWINESNVPHNVVGIYKTTSGQKAVDSGFIERNKSWQYNFNDKGTFEYRCTIHSEEGMKGTIVVEGN
jgi:plastocyanin